LTGVPGDGPTARAQTPTSAPTGDAAGPVVPQRLCLVVPTTADHDSRTHRIAASMSERGHDVVILARARSATGGTGGAGAAAIALDEAAARGGYRTVRLGAESSRRLPLALRVVDRALSTRRQRDAARRVAPASDLYHGMAFMGIPVALDLGQRHHAPVVYDARDLYADARSLARLPRPLRSIVRAREARWARAADRIVTVNDELADVLAKRLGVERPAVVRNCPPRWSGDGQPARRFHEQLGLPADARIVLYHGGLEPGRGIEQLLAADGMGGDVHIVLLGYGRLRPALEARLAGEPGLAARVHLLDPVPPTELLPWVASADLVAVPIQPTTLNHRLSTPNKLYEALGAGVPVVASDFPPMRRIVLGDPDGPLGAVCDPADPAAVARAARSLLSLPPGERAGLRARCLRAAHARYAWEIQVEVLVRVYGSLTGRPW
jgi:glycosyltransferase involved in cell wall biosynthesis